MVTGTVVDPQGIPYAGGTIQAVLTLPVGASGATLNGAQVQGQTGRLTLDSTGSFLMQLPDNAVVLPGGTQWRFDVSIAPGIPPPAGTGPQSFSVNLTITGASQSISTQLQAAASKLGAGPLGGTHSGTETFANINGAVVVDGTTYARTNAGIQAAINATPAGGTVFLPTGTYVLSATTNEQFKITQSINFVCAGWGTNLQLAAGVGAIPVMHIVPSGIVRGIRIQDCAFKPISGTPGSYAIQVDTSPNNNINLFVIDHIQIGDLAGNAPFGTGGIWLNNTGAEVNGGFFDGAITNSYIAGGILCTLCGDSLTISRNLIQDLGSKQTIGVDASFYAGSSSLIIEKNTINPNGAAIHIGSAAIFTQISSNEFETPTSTPSGSNGAFIDIDGTVGNPAAGVDVYRNSFQIVNSSTLNGLRINYAARTNVRDNYFSRGAGTAKDIVVTANATGTRIRPNNFNGESMANTISDSAGAGQTQLEVGGQNLPDLPLTYRDNTGGTRTDGYNGNQLISGQNGANYVYDGSNPGNVGIAISSAPSTVPAVGTHVSVKNLGIGNAGVLISGTAPTITGHFNTSGDSISANNGTAAFTVTVGTGAAGSTGTVGLPTATTGWICNASNRNRGAYIQQTGSTTTSATFTNYGTTVGTPVNWTNSDVLAISCFAY